MTRSDPTPSSALNGDRSPVELPHRQLVDACRALIAEWEAGNERGGEYDLDLVERLVNVLRAAVVALDMTGLGR